MYVELISITATAFYTMISLIMLRKVINVSDTVHLILF